MRFLKRTVRPGILIACLAFAAGCHHPRETISVPPGSLASAAVQDQNADSIALVNVRVAHSDSLQRGRAAELIVTLQYTLAARDQAFLKLSLDQFSNRESCVISSDGKRAPAFQMAAEKEVSVVRGTHTLVIPITWPGDTGEGTGGRIFAAGAISFHASLRTDHPDYEFLVRRFGTQYCMRF